MQEKLVLCAQLCTGGRHNITTSASRSPPQVLTLLTSNMHSQTQTLMMPCAEKANIVWQPKCRSSRKASVSRLSSLLSLSLWNLSTSPGLAQHQSRTDSGQWPALKLSASCFAVLSVTEATGRGIPEACVLGTLIPRDIQGTEGSSSCHQSWNADVVFCVLGWSP